MLNGKYNVSVYNTLGILIERISLEAAENTIRLNDISTGVYYIIFENDKNIYRSSLIIK